MILLVDNGSLSPASALALRTLAAKVSARAGEPVFPVSLLHSSGIPPEKLGGVPAEILEAFLEKKLRNGVSRFRILPVFFGPSLAITAYLPERLDALKRRFPELDATVAPCLCGDPAGDETVAGILVGRIREILTTGTRPAVVLVDHGSPAPAVTAVRDRLATLVRQKLDDEITGVLAASMERRDGPEYAFNEPLLASALRSPELPAGPVIVALQFLFPGRHAGPGGDIATICRNSGRECVITETLGGADELAALLAKRIKS